MIGFDWIIQGGHMSLEFWLLLQALAIVKMVLTVGLSGLALVPAIRLMQSKGRKR